MIKIKILIRRKFLSRLKSKLFIFECLQFATNFIKLRFKHINLAIFSYYQFIFFFNLFGNFLTLKFFVLKRLCSLYKS